MSDHEADIRTVKWHLAYDCYTVMSKGSASCLEARQAFARLTTTLRETKECLVRVAASLRATEERAWTWRERAEEFARNTTEAEAARDRIDREANRWHEQADMLSRQYDELLEAGLKVEAERDSWKREAIHHSERSQELEAERDDIQDEAVKWRREAERLKAERDRLNQEVILTDQEVRDRLMADPQLRERAAMTATLKRVEAERDHLHTLYNKAQDDASKAAEDMVRYRIERDRLREALEAIAGRAAGDEAEAIGVRELARAALSRAEDCACPPGAGGSDDCPIHWR